MNDRYFSFCSDYESREISINKVKNSFLGIGISQRYEVIVYTQNMDMKGDYFDQSMWLGPSSSVVLTRQACSEHMRL